ncbi:hypothetical protein EDB92DRAFT_1856653 [Lactarius akahatsu]|uniref:C2H2-type domain-containing protein n=1 Tax=Lactarius akahatsu TaxID=416441 RepID=A0AAD4QE51_9AGAM|nr:hypothetical protein EDB92DRAFT_1856653 [Lactarius akahatsu]
MGDQYTSPLRLEVPGDLLVQVEVHPAPSTARSDAPHSWAPCPPHSPWWKYIAQVYGQDTPSIILDVPSPGTVWPQSVIGPTTRSPVLSQSQISAKPPLTFPPEIFDASFGNQAVAITDRHARARHNQHIAIQEEQTQLTRCQHLEQGVGSSAPECNIQLCFPRSSANIFSRDVWRRQVPQQQWEGLKAARQDLDPDSTRNSENRSKAPREVHHCINCSKAYRRHQDLKRHTRDKHEWQRKCPFCRARWSRPERIRTHLMKKHESRLTKDQQQEIRFLRGRDDTIRFLEKYGKQGTSSGEWWRDYGIEMMRSEVHGLCF